MYKSTLITFTLLSVATAQTTTNLLLPGFDQQSAGVMASIIDSDATATTYSLACGTDSDSDECGIPSSFTFTQGPSTIHYAFTASYDDETDIIDLGCKLTTDHGLCSGTATGTMNGTLTTSIATSAFSAGDFGALAVTITAGAGGSSTKTAASTAASTTKGTFSAASATSGSAAGTTLTGASAASTSASASESSSVSSAGMAMVTGRPFLGGVAAALAFVAL